MRLLVARTAWLDGRHYWRDGRVSWEKPETALVGEALVPDAAVLSRAQRHLNKIAAFPAAAGIVVGDSSAWLACKRERLSLAKLLRELPKTDLALLARQARQRDPSVAPDLSRLLLAEALCLNALPESPSACLQTLGAPALPALLAVLLSGETPPAARALAALTLGAISRDLDARAAKTLPKLSDPWQDRAFAFGRRDGLPTFPALVTALLVEKGEMPSEVGSRGLSEQLLREMLADGLTAAVVLRLVEATAEAETVLEQMLSIRAVLPGPDKPQDRRQKAETLRAERQQTVQALAHSVAAYAWLSRDPVAVRLVTGFFRRMLDLIASLAPNAETAAAVLEQAHQITRMGLTLPSARQRDFWELLTEQHFAAWDPATLPHDSKPHKSIPKLRSWLHDAQTKHVSPLCTLLAAAQDKATVAAIFEMGVQDVLAQQDWADPDLYRLFVTIAGDLELKRNNFSVWALCWVLGDFSSAREARPYFQAFFQPLYKLSPDKRRHILETLLEEAANSPRQAIRQILTGVASLLPTLVRCAEPENGRQYICGPVFTVAIALVQRVPAQAKERFEQMLSLLPASAWHRWDYGEKRSFEMGMMLAVALAADDAEAFESAVRAAGHHQFRQSIKRIQDGSALLERFSTLRQPLAYLFARQPQRVVELLVRLGLTGHLSTDIKPLLAALEPQAAWDGVSGTAFPVLLHPNRQWWALHQQVPDLTTTANAYRHAQWLQGLSPDLPAGVRRVLDRPQRTATELAHLEEVLSKNPDKAGIPARVAKLRALLGDAPRLAEDISAEVRERLPQVAAEAQMAAIERQTVACYRTRLEAVAGPLPPELVLTEDLQNATLLTVDIAQNRKLLLLLLRAHLSGDHGWREKHPANRAFLVSLAAQGVDTKIWLSESPRRFLCAGVPGGRVHLRLERDPLRVLQMGNHFETCLSFGGINAFSTVANACELNKRVVYACDSAGHVVGRKLIGITAGGELIGFHTYCSLSDETGNQALRRVFRQYGALVAARCGLRLADTGTVPTLFAEAWYDAAAAVPWAEDAEETPSSSEPFKTKTPGSLRSSAG